MGVWVAPGIALEDPFSSSVYILETERARGLRNSLEHAPTSGICSAVFCCLILRPFHRYPSDSSLGLVNGDVLPLLPQRLLGVNFPGRGICLILLFLILLIYWGLFRGV